MDFTQNNRLAQITTQTLIIGVDVAKHKHVARAIDDRGMDLTKRIVFANTLEGFSQLMEWAKELSNTHGRPDIMIGMEPTGHYWLNLAYYLKAEGIKTVVVNPMKVKRSKELDDDSPMKNDTKDAKVIAQVMRDGRYHEPLKKINHPSRHKCIMHYALDCYFPEFLSVFKDWTGKAALHLLDKGYLPEDIVQTSEMELLVEVKQSAKRGVCMKKVQALKQAAENRIGLTTGLRVARHEIRYLVD